jgi:hypothetical protein
MNENPTNSIPTSLDEDGRPPDPPGGRYGRRALMLGVAGAGLAAGVVAGANTAGAANGSDVLLGESNSATATTEVTTTSGDGLQGVTSSDGFSGVAGIDESSSGGHGVYGTSTDGIGVYGTLSSGQSGLLGSSVAGSVGDSSASAGVLGLSSSDDGVQGTTSADGFSGVRGIDQSTGGGYGVYGSSTAGAALKVDGVAEFSRSGTVAITGTSVSVTGVTLTSSSLILATLQGYEKGVAVAGVVPDVAGSSFTIHLTKAAKVSLAVAWFIVG